MIATCSAAKPLEKPNQQPAVLRIHYVRKDGNYKVKVSVLYIYTERG
jgi:hypothetical protein